MASGTIVLYFSQQLSLRCFFLSHSGCHKIQTDKALVFTPHRYTREEPWQQTSWDSKCFGGTQWKLSVTSVISCLRVSWNKRCTSWPCCKPSWQSYRCGNSTEVHTFPWQQGKSLPTKWHTDKAWGITWGYYQRKTTTASERSYIWAGQFGTRTSFKSTNTDIWRP